MSELRSRTKQFAVAIFQVFETLPDEPSCKIIHRQLIRSALSIGATYRATCHARSRAEFLAKMAMAEEEAHETEYWLELLLELNHVPKAPLDQRRDEVHHLTSMIIASIKTARKIQA